MAEARNLPVRSRGRRSPAVPVTLSVFAGIVTDWYGNFLCLSTLILGGCLMAVWIGLFWIGRRNPFLNRLSASLLLLACGCLGAAWHQWQWSLIRSDHVLAFVSDEPRPVHLQARVVSDPVLIHPEPGDFPTAITRKTRTLANLRVQVLFHQRREIPVSGLVRLDIVGELDALPPGTVVDVLGVISRPSPVSNPGGFDFRMFLRESGIHALVRCDLPGCVRIVSPAPGGIWPFFRSWQKTLADRLRARLTPGNAPVAVALLLGPRSDIPKELKDAFLQTGTVHFLAISGANVAILVLFLWPFSQLLRLPQRVRLIGLALCVWGYVLITDCDPPVIRAAVIVSLWLVSLFVGRGLATLNQFALAALIIAIRNPHDIFQAGAQLSFLAILALHWLSFQSWFSEQTPVDPLDALTQRWWHRAAAWTMQNLRTAFLASATVWVFTLPLILARFHLVSPLGFVVNIFLQLWMVLTLLLGYASLLGVLLFPPLAWITAPFFDVGLTVFTATVRIAASVPWGHFQLPGPDDWWLAVYCGLVIVIASGALPLRLQRLTWMGLLAWCVVGIGSRLPPREQPELRCTFLSVGHGAAILLEFPNRRTLLYDAGSLEDAARSSRAVEGLLLQRGLLKLDAILISHADIDHFNGVPQLLDHIPIGELLVSPAFLDFHQDSVRRVCTAAIETSVPIKLLWKGDLLSCCPEVSVEVLHPTARRPGGDDNANSVVLSVTYANRRILLTGDLEKEGLLEFLRRPQKPHDILLSPHHGSQKANTPELARWVSPRWVVVSGGHDASWKKLRENYGEGATLLSTAKHGAITFEISPHGEITVQTHLPAVPIVVP